MESVPTTIFRFLKNKLRRRTRVKSTIATITEFMQGKRQRFIVAVLFLMLALFFSSELRQTTSGVFIAVFLAIATSAFFFLTNYQDIRSAISPYVFVLPFFYSLSCGLFYSLVPDRFLTRITMTAFYGIGLYSLFLSQNIFTVAAIRTIALLASARTVSFILTIFSYFFLMNVIFSLHFQLLPSALLIFVSSFFLIHHAVWARTLSPSLTAHFLWTLFLSFTLVQIGLLMWFWPSSPTMVALFLTGIFYAYVGLAHVWFDKRLFRAVLWEYIWVAITILFILLLFTSWNG